MPEAHAGATIPEVTHHRTKVNGEQLHYVIAGESGTPVLLVHGFPESWWAFRGVIPALATTHQVIAVDLPGFGDSAHCADDYSSTAAAETLRQLIETALPGLGLEMLADVARGGFWHIGVLAAPGIPEMLLSGREREFLADYAYPR